MELRKQGKQAELGVFQGRGVCWRRLAYLVHPLVLTGLLVGVQGVSQARSAEDRGSVEQPATLVGADDPAAISKQGVHLVNDARPAVSPEAPSLNLHAHQNTRERACKIDEWVCKEVQGLLLEVAVYRFILSFMLGIVVVLLPRKR